MRTSTGFRRRIDGYGLTTAEILDHLPDHPHRLQTFVWQHHGLVPLFPASWRSGGRHSRGRCPR